MRTPRKPDHWPFMPKIGSTLRSYHPENNHWSRRGEKVGWIDTPCIISILGSVIKFLGGSEINYSYEFWYQGYIFLDNPQSSVEEGSSGAWIARDVSGDLYIYDTEPVLDTDTCIYSETGESCDQINKDLFPEVTFDNGPLRIRDLSNLDLRVLYTY
jgi:hypothetical protein